MWLSKFKMQNKLLVWWWNRVTFEHKNFHHAVSRSIIVVIVLSNVTSLPPLLSHEQHLQGNYSRSSKSYKTSKSNKSTKAGKLNTTTSITSSMSSIATCGSKSLVIESSKALIIVRPPVGLVIVITVTITHDDTEELSDNTNDLVSFQNSTESKINFKVGIVSWGWHLHQWFSMKARYNVLIRGTKL